MSNKRDMNNKRDYVVALFHDYDNTWRDVTKPLTLKQAIEFLRIKRWKVGKTVQIVHLADRLGKQFFQPN
jgi:hypothetical protein